MSCLNFFIYNKDVLGCVTFLRAAKQLSDYLKNNSLKVYNYFKNYLHMNSEQEMKKNLLKMISSVRFFNSSANGNNLLGAFATYEEEIAR